MERTSQELEKSGGFYRFLPQRVQNSTFSDNFSILNNFWNFWNYLNFETFIWDLKLFENFAGKPGNFSKISGNFFEAFRWFFFSKIRFFPIFPVKTRFSQFLWFFFARNISENFIFRFVIEKCLVELVIFGNLSYYKNSQCTF